MLLQLLLPDLQSLVSQGFFTLQMQPVSSNNLYHLQIEFLDSGSFQYTNKNFFPQQSETLPHEATAHTLPYQLETPF
jgi:hypothetical protein